jgi:pyruvate dehydrogenase E2 component (dihydrolipoamide acetyltransferase)
MPTDVLMPKLSDTMEEGKILKWLKAPGDVVKQGDLLAEVETDKANMEIESFDEGVVTEIKVPEGASAPVGAVIAVLGEAGTVARAPAKEAPAAKEAPRAKEAVPAKEAPAAKASSGAAPAPKEEPATKAAAPAKAAPAPPASATPAHGTDDRVKASPLAKKIAAERGIDLAGVAGSGPGGRIVRTDVEGGAPAAAAPAARPGAAPPAGRHVELSRIRRTTAKRMAEAAREIPHFYVSADVDMDAAVRLRDELVARGGEFEGTTLTHLIVKACGLALRRVPAMNASLDGEATVEHAQVNVGLATATDEGLLVPVVHNCDTASLAEIVSAARGLVERARAGKPARDDLSGATFSLSNLGMFPVAHFAAVVNPPQAAILAVGTVREVPVVRDEAVVPGRLMTVTVSCDHRILDGAVAGRFLAELKTLLEHPLGLVV